MSEINILLYEQLAGLMKDVTGAKQFSTQTTNSRPIWTLHIVCVHLLGASSEFS